MVWRMQSLQWYSWHRQPWGLSWVRRLCVLSMLYGWRWGRGPFVPEPGTKAGQGIHLWLLSSCFRQNQIGFCVPGENEPECYDCRSVSSFINSNTSPRLEVFAGGVSSPSFPPLPPLHFQRQSIMQLKRGASCACGMRSKTSCCPPRWRKPCRCR